MRYEFLRISWEFRNLISVFAVPAHSFRSHSWNVSTMSPKGNLSEIVYVEFFLYADCPSRRPINGVKAASGHAMNTLSLCYLKALKHVALGRSGIDRKSPLLPLLLLLLPSLYYIRILDAVISRALCTRGRPITSLQHSSTAAAITAFVWT